MPWIATGTIGDFQEHRDTVDALAIDVTSAHTKLDAIIALLESGGGPGPTPGSYGGTYSATY